MHDLGEGEGRNRNLQLRQAQVFAQYMVSRVKADVKELLLFGLNLFAVTFTVKSPPDYLHYLKKS